jgi:hypothetical protein
MAASHVQVQPDSTGKDVDADALTSTEAGTPTVYRQNVVISDPVTYANKASVSSSGGVAVRGVLPPIQTLAVTAATPVTGTGLNVSEAGNVTFIVKNTTAATAFTGVPVIAFEQSDDNVSWCPLAVTSVNLATASQPVIATGVANVSQMFDAAIEGVNWVRVRVITAQATNGMTVITQPGGMAFSPSVASIAPAPAVSALSNVTGSVTSGTLLASNTSRKQALFFNDSSASLFLGYTSSAVSATSYSVKIAPMGYYEVPWPIYTGQINGIWDAATGAARITELT